MILFMGAILLLGGVAVGWAASDSELGKVASQADVIQKAKDASKELESNLVDHYQTLEEIEKSAR